MDNFYEQLVKTEKSAKYTAANFATYALGALGLLLGGAGGPGGVGIILGIIFIGIAVGLFFLKKNFYVEYEYNLTNGEIDIDKIFEMKSRKRAISFNVKDLELLAPEDSNYVKDFANKPDRVIKMYPEGSKEKIYVGMLTGGSERAQLYFTPNEQFLEYCYKYNPRAIKKGY